MTDFNSKAWGFDQSEAPKEGLGTPEEMRAEMDRVSYHNVLIKTVDNIARFKGLSGEDKYTLLAYYALIEMARYKKMVLEFSNLAANPPMMLVEKPAGPINMVLYCPKCGMQHIDAPMTDAQYTKHLHESSWWELGGDKPERWTNPPHRSHLCRHCGWIWRPADVPTNGVAAINTKGKKDGAPK